jgi:hypothetical protein
MAKRIRDVVTGQLTLDYFMQKAAAGWTLAAVEWVREAEAAESDAAAPASVEVGFTTADVPFGFRIAASGLDLEQNPLEMTVLLLILENIVKEKRLTDIAAYLNAGGYATRQGANWTPAAIFNLLPRLIEMGPSLLKSPDWQARRSQLT